MKRYIKCPYCQHTFSISEAQQAWNTRFKCPKCKRYNAGSTNANTLGVLQGIRLEDARYL